MKGLESNLILVLELWMKDPETGATKLNQTPKRRDYLGGWYAGGREMDGIIVSLNNDGVKSFCSVDCCQ